MPVIPRRVRRHERGAAMVEALLSMFVIFLVLFGMLQVFYFFTGQLYTDYSALRGARSRAVGFSEYLVARELRVNAIGGSGPLVEPQLSSSVSDNFSDRYPSSQISTEMLLISRYMVGSRWIEYEFWFKPTEDDQNASNSPYTSNIRRSNSKINTELLYYLSTKSNMVDVTATFTDYAFPDTYTKRLFFGDGINLTGTASLSDQAQVYLED